MQYFIKRNDIVNGPFTDAMKRAAMNRATTKRRVVYPLLYIYLVVMVAVGIGWDRFFGRMHPDKKMELVAVLFGSWSVVLLLVYGVLQYLHFPNKEQRRYKEEVEEQEMKEL